MRHALLPLLVATTLSVACSALRTDPSGVTDQAATTDTAPPFTVAASDIAVLFPLSASASGPGLWPALHPVPGGRALLPLSIVKSLGPIVEGDRNADTYGKLRVVSLRLEPCFRAKSGSACERQVRFVLQPVVPGPADGMPTKSNVTTLDAAVHVLYDVPPDAFDALVRGLVELRSARTPAPLGVHAVLAAEGLGGPFARALEERVFAAVGKGSLVRVTFMGVRGRGNEWQFGGVNVGSGDTTTPLPIPSNGPPQTLQSLVLQRSGDIFQKFLSPQTAGADDVAILFDSLSAAYATDKDIAAALAAANRIENPDRRTSEDTDCVTCHTIASSRLWAEKTKPTVSADRFVSAGAAPFVPSSVTADLGVLRAFGYFGAAPVISPRAANDIEKAAQVIRTTGERQ